MQRNVSLVHLNLEVGRTERADSGTCEKIIRRVVNLESCSIPKNFNAGRKIAPRGLSTKTFRILFCRLALGQRRQGGAGVIEKRTRSHCFELGAGPLSFFRVAPVLAFFTPTLSVPRAISISRPENGSANNPFGHGQN